MIAGLVLAAGAGRRLGGRPKALLPFRGKLLIEHVVANLTEAGCSPVIAVLGAADTPPLDGATKVHNAQWETGMGSSLRIGLESLPPNVSGVVVVLVDQPGITPAAIRRVMQAGAAIAQATYGPSRGHPVFFSRGYLAEVAESAHDDVGARDFLRAHIELVTLVPCEDVADPADIDTPSDLARLDYGK